MIAVDWGTSSFRAYKLDAHGKILEARSAAKGILAVEAGHFPEVLEEQVGGWLAAGEAPVVMSGMVGSRQGWAEVPYVQCPAGFDELARNLKRVEWGKRQAWIVPGLSFVDEAGVPDVMRGEEVQILGALPALPREGCWICLPGTHSKWVFAKENRIVGFGTHMTGELFSVLKSHSILGRTMQEGALDETAFAEGVQRSGEAGGLLHHLFGVRTRGLFGELSGSQAPWYLSGLLIGHELRQADVSGKILLLGTPELTAHYLQAAELLGIKSEALDPQAAARALWLLAKDRN
jgi:2-dehydro-3-deoxygalactonokinase